MLSEDDDTMREEERLANQWTDRSFSSFPPDSHPPNPPGLGCALSPVERCGGEGDV